MLLDPNFSPFSFAEGNWSQYCQKNCFQNYLAAADDFFNECSALMVGNPAYDLIIQVAAFQNFRGQACGA